MSELFRKLGAGLRGILSDDAAATCPFCHLPLEVGPYHEFDMDAVAWRCKTILEPR